MRPHRVALGLLLAACQLSASAQLLETERLLTRPVEPGEVAPHQATPR